MSQSALCFAEFVSVDNFGTIFHKPLTLSNKCYSAVSLCFMLDWQMIKWVDDSIRLNKDENWLNQCPHNDQNIASIFRLNWSNNTAVLNDCLFSLLISLSQVFFYDSKNFVVYKTAEKNEKTLITFSKSLFCPVLNSNQVYYHTQHIRQRRAF